MNLSRRQSLFEIHLATILFGLAGLFGKWITLSPFLIVLGRVFFASLTLGLLLVVRKKSMRHIFQGKWYLWLGLGFILAVHWVAFFKSIQVSSVAVGLLSYSCFPLFTVVLEPIFLRESFDSLGLVFAGLCLFGVFLIIPRFDPADVVYRGVLWGLLSGMTFAVLTVFNRRLSQKHSSLAIAFFEDVFAALFLLPFFFLNPGGITVRHLLLLAILGIVCTAGSHTLFIKGMRQIRAQTASLISTLEPVYGIVLAYLLLQEIPRLRTLAGGIIILGTVLITSLREGSQPQPSSGGA